MEIIILWLMFAAVVGIIANNRHRSGIGWFVLAVVISPLLALILVLALDRPKPEAQPVEDETKTTKICPRCAERSKLPAMVCRFCGYEFPVLAGKRIYCGIFYLVHPDGRASVVMNGAERWYANETEIMAEIEGGKLRGAGV